MPSWLGAIAIGPLRRSAYSSGDPGLAAPSCAQRSFSVARARDLEDGADLQMVLQVLADAGQLVHAPHAERAQHVRPADAGHSSSCGEPMAPAASTTSRRAAPRATGRRRQTTPVARLPSNSIARSTMGAGQHRRLAGCAPGAGTPCAVFQRTPRCWLTSK